MKPGILQLAASGGTRATASLVLTFCIATSGLAQETITGAQSNQGPVDQNPSQGSDLADMSLEELMSIDMRNYTGVIGGHTHLAGEWMFGYRYMLMEMDGLRDGTDSQSTSEVLSNFMVAPLEMTMQMHMFELMYAPSDELTMMLMVPYHQKSMDHVNRMGARFTTKSEGLGDVSLTGLYTFWRNEDQEMHAGFGLGFPTGSISARDTTPMGSSQKLPYPMQIGSGTFDLRPTITYVGQNDSFGWGLQARSKLRLGENRDDYRLGNRYGLMAWGEIGVTNWLSLSARIDSELWGNVHGADADLNPMMAPTADPDRQGGERIDALLGFHLFNPGGAMKGQRLDFEIGMPIHQDLDGPQMETELLLTASWRWTF